MFQIELTRPEWLLALFIVPVLIFYFYRSLVDFPRRQMICSLLIRSIIATLLVLALAGLNLLKSTQEMFVVFALDDSLSVDDESRQKALEYIQKAIDSADDKTAFQVLPFATTPGKFSSTLPEKPLEDVPEIEGEADENDTATASTVEDPTAADEDKTTDQDETAVAKADALNPKTKTAKTPKTPPPKEEMA